MFYTKDGYKVFVEVEKTRKTYESLLKTNSLGSTSNCPCTRCQNVENCINQGVLPRIVQETCSSFGIDHTLTGEYYSLSQHDSGEVAYHGFYSFYGIILESPKSMPQVFFEGNSPLGTPGFPETKDVILVGFSLNLLWLMSEPYGDL